MENERMEDLLLRLSDEGKAMEEAEEINTSLPSGDPKGLTITYLRGYIEKQNEEIEGIKQDREQRKIFGYIIFVFMSVYMAASITLVFLRGYGRICLSDAVLITLLTTSLASVIGIFNFVAKYLFHPKS